MWLNRSGIVLLNLKMINLLFVGAVLQAKARPEKFDLGEKMEQNSTSKLLSFENANVTENALHHDPRLLFHSAEIWSERKSSQHENR